jgi:6-phosphogluconolactonase
MKPTRNPYRFAASLVLLLLTFVSAAIAAPQNYILYLGTYTENGSTSKGIYAYRYDAVSGHITPLGLAAETTDPSWLALDPNSRFLYAVNEVGNYQGPNSGGVSAFAIDRASGKLTFLNEVSSRGAGPCYITLDKTGRYALVANYDGGSVAVFPILADGRLGEASDVVQHKGHGPNSERQEGPHPHSIVLTRDNRFAIVSDLGLDELFVYRFESTKGTLIPNNPPFTRVDPGAGPRHFALSANERFAYSLDEMGALVTVFSNDPETEVMRQLQTISTLPPDFTGPKEDAEIEVAPSGKFLYASNRGHDAIAVFAIDPEKGTLTLVEITPIEGKESRSFAIDPTGTRLFAAIQDSNRVVIFRIDGKTGRLTRTGESFEVAAPVCLKFLSVR